MYENTDMYVYHFFFILHYVTIKSEVAKTAVHKQKVNENKSITDEWLQNWSTFESVDDSFSIQPLLCSLLLLWIENILKGLSAEQGHHISFSVQHSVTSWVFDPIFQFSFGLVVFYVIECRS